MKQYEKTIKAFDGTELHMNIWEPCTPPLAAICLIHGLGEHSGRYRHVAEAFTAAGYSLTGIDLRGHGKSRGKKGHSPGFDYLMKDISSLLEESKNLYPQLPVFLYGHSMGGNLVLNYALRYKPGIKGIISTSPWLNLAFEPPAYKVKLGEIMNFIWPSFTQSNTINSAELTHNTVTSTEYDNDELVHDKISARLFIDIYQSGLWAMEHAEAFTLPLLLMHGTADKVTSCASSMEFARKAGKDCTMKPWEGLYHEIHREYIQQEVIDYMINWIGSKV